jgi:RimJ/RimL family protein N-acetyltransferase
MTDVALTPLAEEHLGNLLHWLEDQAIRDGILSDQVITPAGHRSWFRAQRQDASQAVFAILGGSRHVGVLGFRSLSKRHETGELWMYIGSQHQRQGLGRGALRAGVEIGFNKLGLRKISLSVRIDNTPAVGLYAREGFIVEGVLRADRLYRGTPVDLLRMALLRARAAPASR